MKVNEFLDIITPMQRKLFRFALRLVDNVSEAEDVVQDVFLKLWKDPAQLRKCRNAEAWCMTMVRNRSLDRLRTEVKRKHIDIVEAWNLSHPGPTPHQSAEQNETMARVKGIIADLPDQQREVLHLRDVEGYAYEEIADMTGMNLGQVKVNIHRARRKVREQMENLPE
ncbi:DNA-directed RNA polymerase sigma-70 factor (plasmid) [Fulvitalea axinellae]|uniref:DNA-directed RNA polymerase sigma-70 factor n=1 Tax=Fulvitalea axinellae TaxID=1182444 RepID=A0AAU9CY16_9BACT|nr:DNA-directed RNA polymerase sigma-70 factor [Fulvitalea axinellae]